MSDLFTGFPPVKGIRWFNASVLLITPIISVYGLLHGSQNRQTVIFACFYYIFSMLGITAGYHRLWSHRAYNATLPLQIFLLAGGTSAVQGTCYFWCRTHRAHHRHTDTDLDPYNTNRGLLWTHLGWMVVKTDLHIGSANVTDLKNDPLLQFQSQWYFQLALLFGCIVPTIIPWIFWNDLFGGFFIAGCLRLTVAHHSTFCINSIAHYLGSTTYDDKLSPRDHFFSALLTMGEGYHNFHHQFPMDYRNAFRWYQWDPTKWFIAVNARVGLASHLRVFPSNEIEKGSLSMKLRELKKVQDAIKWPVSAENLPVVTWDTCLVQEQSKTETLILIGGHIHNATEFAERHPGGASLISNGTGKDMTAAFFGGMYSHSHAAHNLLSMMRVGILHGGVEMPNENEECACPPGQRLFVGVRGIGQRLDELP